MPVFPVRADKRPATIHGFKDAVHDPGQVASLWRRHPGPLIGVPTGEASGLDALDIDPRHGGDKWWLDHVHLMPATRMHRTRSNGLHALFRHAPSVRNTESKIAVASIRGARAATSFGGRRPGAALSRPHRAMARMAAGKPAARRRAGAASGRTFRALDSADHAHRVAERVLAGIKRASDGQRYYVLRKGAYTLGGLLAYLPFGETEAVERRRRGRECRCRRFRSTPSALPSGG